MKILCIGQSAYDITLPVNGYPEENKKYKIDKRIECGGGSANNAAYLLATWGNDVYLASSIGKDDYAKKIKEELAKANVNTSYFEEIEGVNTTTSYIINNLENGSRTILTNKDSLMHFTKPLDLSFCPDIIFMDGNDYEASLDVLRKYPKAIKIIDAGSLKKGSIELCQLCDYIVCSNDFAKDYTNINFSYDDMDTIKEVYEKMAQDFNGQLVITLESHGSFTKINDEYYLVPSIKVNSIDSTGAGDIYHGAFTHFIAKNYSLLETMRLSNIAGALSVTKIGSKSSMPSLFEVLNYHEL